MKKIISMIAAFMLVAGVTCGCSTNKQTETTETAKTQTIELGTSGLSMDIPESYAKGEISAKDTDESQVAYYVSEESKVDFDVYQWAKAEGETLESTATAEAAEYNSKATAGEFNGVSCMYYEATEESEGTEYKTVSYLFENGDFFAEIVFWMDGDTAADEVSAMINTIAVTGSGKLTTEGTEIVLGTSALKITTPFVYAAGEITAKDTDENQVAYYVSEESKVDFDVYQWAKAEGETLESVATAEAAEYNSKAVAAEFNGVSCMYYEAVEESDGVEYKTVTYIVEDGNDFVEIVFWLDGDNAQETVNSIISTLKK